jgi:hypothetical protein
MLQINRSSKRDKNVAHGWKTPKFTHTIDKKLEKIIRKD